VTQKIELLTAAAARACAEPLSLLHGATFPDDPWSPAAIAEITGLAGFFALVARRDGALVGFALAFGACEECEIAALGVLLSRRRTGVGAALLDRVCGEARRRAARAVVLEVAADNVAAQALYAASGFVSVGRRRNYYRRGEGAVDAVLLRLTLVRAPTSI
jgi:[ribosomal protein S18]-alanine N-acetyltransferase